MKIEKRIVAESRWSTAKRVAAAAVVGVSVCLPLSACNDDDSSPVAPASQVEESSPSTEPDSSAEVAPQSSSAAVSSSSSYERLSSMEPASGVSSSSGSPLHLSSSSAPDAQSSATPASSDSAVPDSGASSNSWGDIPGIGPNDTHPCQNANGWCGMGSMPTPVGHVHYPLLMDV